MMIILPLVVFGAIFGLILGSSAMIAPEDTPTLKNTQAIEQTYVDRETLGGQDKIDWLVIQKFWTKDMKQKMNEQKMKVGQQENKNSTNNNDITP